MKTFNFLWMALIASMLCLSLNSCGGDDDGKPEDETTNGGSSTPEDNLPEASKAFVGYWISSFSDNSHATYSNWIFYVNGTCQQRYYYIGSFSNYTDGYWTYNPKTSILATTANAWQWQITLSNYDSWAGITTSGKSQSYNKASNYKYFYECLSTYKWKTDTNEISESLYQFLSSFYPSNNSPYAKFEEDENAEDFIFKYTVIDFIHDRILDTGTITVIEPYHSNKCQLIVSGNIKKTLTLYNE